MNLLFTSVGRRGYLLRYFRNALADKGVIHAANSGPMAPAFLEADRTVITPLIYDPNYIGFLLDYCKKHSIDAVIPLFDVDIAKLAEHRKEFTSVGTRLVVSEPRVANICNDKWETYQFLVKNGIGTPTTFHSLSSALDALNAKKVDYPVYVKPRWGMGSIGVYRATNENELSVLHEKVKDEVLSSYLKYESAIDMERSVLIQECSPGIEHGLDIVNDLNGDHICTIVKQKLSMRSGETDSACTVDEPSLRELGAQLASLLGHFGNLDVDVFLNGTSAQVLEMNARFGGGYPFSHLAGADLPKAILKWLKGESADPSCFQIQYGIKGTKVIEPVLFNCDERA